MTVEPPVDWAQWDGKMLDAIAEWEASDEANTGFVRLAQLFERFDVEDVEQWKLARAVQRLKDAGLIEAEGDSRRLGTGRAYPTLVKGLTPAGLREVGRWPTQENALKVMIGVLLATAAEVRATEPEEASRLTRVAGFLERQLAAGVSGFGQGLGGALGQAFKGW